MSDSGKKTDESEPSLEDYVISQADMQDEPEHITDEEHFDASDDVPVEEVKSRRYLGWGAGLTLTVMGICLGAIGGWGLSRLMPPPTATFDDSALLERLTALENSKAAMSKDVTRLKSDMTEVKAAGPKEDDATESIDLAAIENRIADLELRLTERQKTPSTVDDEGAPNVFEEPNVIDSPDDSMEPPSLESNDAVASNETAPPPAFNGVTLEEFETALTALRDDYSQQIAANTGTQQQSTSDIAALYERLETLQRDIATAKEMAANPIIVKEAVLLPPYPRDAIFEAITQVETKEDAGWISKTLGRHITVRDPDDVDMATKKLTAIMAAIETDDIQEALALTQSLPPEGVALASDWIKAVKRQ
ncbi:MAG: hypothetical protein ACPGVT_07540 [Maricaulaceae bacterium]